MLVLFLLPGLVGPAAVILIENRSVVAAVRDLVGPFRYHAFDSYDFLLAYHLRDRCLHGATAILYRRTQATSSDDTVTGFVLVVLGGLEGATALFGHRLCHDLQLVREL